MRKQLAGLLQNAFVAEMARRLPGFLPSSEQWDVFSLEVSSELYFFVHLSIDDDKNSFTLEVASNAANRFPWTELPGQLRDVPKASSAGLWRFRISKLWGEVKDFRWHIGEAAAPDVDSIRAQVSKAIDKVCHYGVPYFEKAARNYGHRLHVRVEA